MVGNPRLCFAEGAGPRKLDGRVELRQEPVQFALQHLGLAGQQCVTASRALIERLMA
jgi:hypothetical protein